MTQTVTICIPTYQSESFIDRTLNCARSQTHEEIRIIVSVDPSDDKTAEICQQHALEDDRIDVLVQQERLGWSQNANAVLDCADTEFFFLYFHDDIIEPTYVETLLRVLVEHPNACSAHCDLVEYGLLDEVKPAHDYLGTPLRRIVDFMMTQRGTTLRSMIRNNTAAKDIRFPKLYSDTHWAAYVFHLRLLATGDAIAVHEPLYRRWQREGSLTRSAGWQRGDFGSALQSQRQAVLLCTEIVERAAGSDDERLTGLYCLQLFQRLFTRQQQLALPQYRKIKNRDLAEPTGIGQPRLVPGVLDPEAEEWVSAAEKRLRHYSWQVTGARLHHFLGRIFPLGTRQS